MEMGVIVSPHIAYEVFKDELLRIDDAKRPWLRAAGLQDGVDVVLHLKDGQKVTTDDRAIAQYVRAQYAPRVRVNCISPQDPDAKAKVAQADLTFLLIYDMLEAHHTEPDANIGAVRDILSMPNVYPPYDYQAFINNKATYYAYLKDRGITVVPFVHLTRAEFHNDRSRALAKILGMQVGDHGKIICKPIYGQESIDFEVFHAPLSASMLEHHCERMFKLYDGVVFQAYVHAFAMEQNEFKLMFVGDKLMYGIREDPSKKTDFVVIDLEKEKPIVDYAKHVFGLLPPITMNGIVYPRLLTRIDIGCCWNGAHFVSEVEFVPSLFMNLDKVADALVDVAIGDQMALILEFHNSVRRNVKATETPPVLRWIGILILVLVFTGLLGLARAI